VAVPADYIPDSPASTSSRWRRLIWAGVLPEPLGLCFVAIIFGGFAAAYFTADYSWKRQSAVMRQAEAETFTRGLAAILGSLSEASDESVDGLLQEFTQLPRVRAVRWTLPDGKMRFAWPPAAVLPGDTLAHTPEPPRSGAELATAAVHTASGAPLGTLVVETTAPAGAEYRAALIWNWGIAAGATLLVFALAYHRLRRHLRPMAAVERNLRSLASGIEKDLVTLTLSDTLGSVAQGWNQLIEQLNHLQRQSQATQQASQVQNVLARFEHATFRRVVERLPFGVLCVGEHQNINYVNAAAAALLGRPADELSGKPVPEVIDAPPVTQALAGVQARPGATLTVDHARQEGEHEATLRFRILPIADQPGGDTLITIEDIGQLREDQRARDNFLYHVTHELRTPLTSIHAYAETLTKPGFDDEQTRKECYNVIISETRRLSSLVENILSISQLEVGTARLDIGEVDLVRLTRQMVQDNLGAADQKTIDLTLVLPPKVPKLRGDKQRLSVLLTNLIGNAIKYTKEGGRVQVCVEVSDYCLRIVVSDTGIGIAPEDQLHVFDKFYRAASDEVQTIAGTGLGLAIAREVARLHGGDILLESELGKGSKFVVELPLPANDRAEVLVR
jgi:PAS domain S-box-containing protein